MNAMLANTDTADTLDHKQVAELIDTTFNDLAAIGRHLGPVDGIAGTPGRALLDGFAGLAELRRLLDGLRTGAGADPAASPYYAMRAMRPSATTRAAARAAQPWPYSTVEHDNLARVHRLPGPITVRSPG